MRGDSGLRIDRRGVLAAAPALLLLASTPALAAPVPQPPIARVIIDNDFSGDPDGLFQLAHHLLCGSVRIPLVIGSHLPAPFGNGHDAQDAAALAREVVAMLGMADRQRVIAGAETSIRSIATASPSAATQAIVREAMRTDTTVPLIYAAGASLTELALAWLAEPRIGKRIRLIWIGGNPHPGLADPTRIGGGPEFNFAIDPLAAQVVFNQSDIEIWQVPSDQYRTMLFGMGELEELGTLGRLGTYLKTAVDRLPEMLAKIPGFPAVPRTDAFVLGDNPLVTLSALVPPIAPDPTSSRYRTIPTPTLGADGGYVARPGARPMRVYTEIDADLTLRDMMARFRLFASADLRARPQT